MHHRGPRLGAIPLLLILTVVGGGTRAAYSADLIYPTSGSTKPHIFEWRLYSAADGIAHTEFFDVEARDVFALGPWTRIGSTIPAASICESWQTHAGPVTMCWFAMPDRLAEYRVRACNSGYGCGEWAAEPVSELIECCRAAPDPPPDETCYAGLALPPIDCQ